MLVSPIVLTFHGEQQMWWWMIVNNLKRFIFSYTYTHIYRSVCVWSSNGQYCCLMPAWNLPWILHNSGTVYVELVASYSYSYNRIHAPAWQCCITVVIWLQLLNLCIFSVLRSSRILWLLFSLMLVQLSAIITFF